MDRPKSKDYPPYYSQYIDLVSGDVMKVLQFQRKEMKYFLFSLMDLNHSYGKNKWTIRQSLIHLIDTERIFMYRALCISRGEEGTLPGFEQDDYAAIDFSHLDNIAIWREFNAVRKSTIRLLENMTESMLNKKGNVSDYQLRVSAVPFIIAGHQIHHFNLFKEKYGINIA